MLNANLFAAKQADAEKIHNLELEISQVKENLSEAESYVVEISQILLQDSHR